MDKNFLLNTELSRQLYFGGIQSLPLIDYHNHLTVSDIVQDRKYQNITELWLAADPYKHRAMRILGVDETYITGKASDFEKFRIWSQCVTKLVGNPLYCWTAMELERVFGIEEPLCLENAEKIWEQTGEMLKEPEFSAQEILRRFQVDYAAPCCGIWDDIDILRQTDCLSPSFRGDGIFPLNRDFLIQLEEKCGLEIRNLQDVRNALSGRMEDFHQAGCRFADHALDDGFSYVSEDGHNDQRLKKVLEGKQLDSEETIRLSSAVLRILAGEYARRGWVMQLHMGALRHTSSRLRCLAGPAGGYAGIGECAVGDIVKLLDDLESQGELPRVILFPLNPSDNEKVSVLSGSFVERGMPGKVQQGAAWWWCDHFQGIRQVLETISAYGVLSVFFGMTTDSRSLLSFVRHDYFRRILCGWLGERAEQMGCADRFDILQGTVWDICYGNLKSFLRASGIVTRNRPMKKGRKNGSNLFY